MSLWAKKIIAKLDAFWGHASEQQLMRVWADSNGDNIHLLNYVDGVLERREVCGAFDKAPHAPVAGRSAVSTSTEKLGAGSLLLDDLIALRAMDATLSTLLRPLRVRRILNELGTHSVAHGVAFWAAQGYPDGRMRRMGERSSGGPCFGAQS